MKMFKIHQCDEKKKSHCNKLQVWNLGVVKPIIKYPQKSLDYFLIYFFLLTLLAPFPFPY